jgi:hypothetical protein
MSDNQKSRRSEADAQLEREIRNERKFTLEEAIGRLAGPGALKGESPIARKTQAAVEIETWLGRHLTDAAGALHVVLFRRVRESELLLKNYEQPLVVLAAYCQQVLDSEYSLRELVRESDAECARIFGERPYFDQEGSPPHPDDCYTVESVRSDLSELIKQLAMGEGTASAQ